MYRLKPVFELKEISVPTNMYKMRNLQSTGIINCSDTATNGTGLEDDTGLEKIRKRQEILLLKLAEIKKILSTLKDELHAPKIATVGSGTLNMCNKPNFTEVSNSLDMVRFLFLYNFMTLLSTLSEVLLFHISTKIDYNALLVEPVKLMLLVMMNKILFLRRKR